MSAPRDGWLRLGFGRPAADSAVVRAATEWRQTFDAIDSPIVVMDLDGRLTRLNLSAQRLLGFEFKDLLGRTLGSIAPWQPWLAVAELAREVSKAGAGGSRRARGERSREWEVSASLVPGESHEDRRIIVLARDVTAVLRLEASLRRVDSMATLGALVSGVAHEVRNPLFAISAIVDALEARATDRGDLAPFMGTLRGEVDRLNLLMRDLLEYGRPHPLELEETDVGEVVARAVRSSQAVAADRQVSIQNLVERGIAHPRVDPARVGQVVQNLVDNAVRLSPPGGRVELHGTVAGADGVQRVEISVADGGPGFPPADLPRVFEPFFSRRPGGTGLGLAIVKRLVEDHGGGVEARNRPGGGAVVSFWVPLDAGASRPTPPPRTPGT